MNSDLDLWQLAIGLVFAITVGGYGLKLMNTPVQRRPRIMRQWPKPRSPDTDTEGVMPPSQRKSSELQPPNVADFSTGG